MQCDPMFLGMGNGIQRPCNVQVDEVTVLIGLLSERCFGQLIDAFTHTNVWLVLASSHVQRWAVFPMELCRCLLPAAVCLF